MVYIAYEQLAELRMIICQEGGQHLDNGMKLWIFTFTCGPREIRPRGLFWIAVLVHLYQSHQTPSGDVWMPSTSVRKGHQLPQWSSWSWEVEEMRTEGDENFCDDYAIRVCRNIPQSRKQYHGFNCPTQHQDNCIHVGHVIWLGNVCYMLTGAMFKQSHHSRYHCSK